MLKRRQHGRPKFPKFLKIRQKIYLSWALIQDASWTPLQEFPRAVQEPQEAPKQPSRSHHVAYKKVSKGRIAWCPCHWIWRVFVCTGACAGLMASTCACGAARPPRTKALHISYHTLPWSIIPLHSLCCCWSWENRCRCLSLVCCVIWRRTFKVICWSSIWDECFFGIWQKCFFAIR